MLVKYKNDYKKIAMGLLSFIPDLKNVARLEDEIEWYQADQRRILYLWKDEDNDFVGVIGIEVSDDIVMVRQLALTPAERKEDVYYQILDAVSSLYPDHKMMGSFDVTSIIARWEQRNDN